MAECIWNSAVCKNHRPVELVGPQKIKILVWGRDWHGQLLGRCPLPAARFLGRGLPRPQKKCCNDRLLGLS